MIKALIFDFDGTIIDTETAWYQAFREAYKEYGVDLSLEQYAQCIGTSLHAFNPYEYLVTDLHLSIDLKAFRQSVQERHARLMDEQTMRQGIFNYLQTARSKHLQIGLASSSQRDWIEHFLHKLNIRDYFECIRSADDVRHVKPDPELYLQALDCLKVHPDEALAIEDSPNGSQAAAAAGIHCVVAPNAITKR
ncbi:MAG: HAD-IA family hydrolase, partial [Firmicutes bacterium]|nr:HAD-IA family hydrolase [Bacillota bacterium]